MKQIKDVHYKIKDLAKAIKICQMKTNMGHWFVSWTSCRKEDKSQGLYSIQGREDGTENNCSITSLKILLKQQKE